MVIFHIRADMEHEASILTAICHTSTELTQKLTETKKVPGKLKQELFYGLQLFV